MLIAGGGRVPITSGPKNLKSRLEVHRSRAGVGGRRAAGDLDHHFPNSPGVTTPSCEEIFES